MLDILMLFTAIRGDLYASRAPSLDHKQTAYTRTAHINIQVRRAHIYYNFFT